MKRLFVSGFLALFFLAAATDISAQCVSLTTLGSASTQNFDTLSNTAGSTTNNLTITGWFLNESGGGARDNEQYGVDTGASNTGDTYSYGSAASADRALGSLRSGTAISTFGACFTNNTGTTIGSLNVAYAGEEWRLGTASRTDQLNFEYSTNATDLVTGAWTSVGALNFVTPSTATVGAKDGNVSANRTLMSSIIGSLSVANGATFWIRWNDVDATSSDDGLAIDDFSLTPNGAAPPIPALTINDVTAVEGNSGTTSFIYTVSLSSPAPAGGVTFDIATADNTATAGNDYSSNSLTTQVIPAGSSTYPFTVTVIGDTNVEPDESFFVNITNVTGATAVDAQGLGTITNDDVVVPNLSIDDVVQTEGNAGPNNFNFFVQLSAPAPAGGVTFDISTVDGTATAASGDYTSRTLTSQTIPAGQQSYQFTVVYEGDQIYENNEQFNVAVTNVVGANVTRGTAFAFVGNDDTLPSLSISDVTQAEGTGSNTTMIFTVTKTGQTSIPVSFIASTVAGTANGTDDYVASSAVYTLQPGDTSINVPVTIFGDALVETDETFSVDISNVTVATVTDGVGVGTITNDDVVLPTISFEFADYSEDESQTMIVNVLRSGDLSGTSTVEYTTLFAQTSNGLGAPDATPGSTCGTNTDFITQVGTLTFFPNDEIKTIEVPICGDGATEVTEGFPLTLSNPVGAEISGNVALLATIRDTASQYVNSDDLNFGLSGEAQGTDIVVSTPATSISGLRVTLYDVQISRASDLDVLLVGPGGQKFLLMADAGGDNGLSSEATITFSDSAIQVLPENDAIVSREYKPTTWEPNQSSFTAPAPAGPYVEPGSTPGGPNTLTSTFGNTNPNGTWSVFVRDDLGAFSPVGLSGQAKGWGLQFLVPTAAGVSVDGSVRNGKSGIANATVTISGGSLTTPLTTRTNQFGGYRFEGLAAGQTYIVTVDARRYSFTQPSIIVSTDDNVTGLDFEAEIQ